jgi:hypothetical protein
MSSKQTTGSELVSGLASLRERIARHFATGAIESNFEASCRNLERLRGAPQVSCPSCDGLGFRALTAAELAVFSQRIAEKEAGGASWKTIDGERRRLNRESICPTCRGTCYVRNTGRDDDAPPDNMFTTIPCDRCRGSMKTKEGTRLRGASCGEIFPPTDASAEWGDVCPKCLGDAYIVKHVARPHTKSKEIERYAEELEDVPIQLGRGSTGAADSPEAVVAEVEHEDPLVAAAMMALLGPSGDTWAQHQWGRRFALWPFTNAGQQLAQEAKLESSEFDGYARALEAVRTARQAEVEADSGSPRRRALLGLADSQARALEQRVERAIRKAEAA